ncbi:LacI family DNA-binding transcriptional regulator [Paraglaciecola chathamensis]|mgnify:CR=1 FL=1|jgi:LacI family transcriptional regulator|uniref:LacI family DNA-binding transcriptional regulator n=1 Tax=Paraglaciecola chathamensis TaxID=368405 RepID=UPI0026F64A91|nr:LacI family DNA-binding transcriptional regulator [Paraglaciecola chathamensis]MDO6561308.1 LacI family DNA-binding transcriptional regulator [Paraglaciecola chathamensis]|tara:strand:+ start:717 stop:1733 length:1017 start_codon:yes stop_codon:yes gene_type:complete
MPTIKDIAKAAGVSPASVSRVINNGPKVGAKTREKIKRIIREMEYQPNANAQAINMQNNASIGIVLADLTDPLFAKMAHGIEKVAAEQNLQIFLNSGAFDRASELDAIEVLLEHRYQALVVHSAMIDDKTLIDFARKVPGLVLLNRYIKEIEDRCIWLDDKLGGALMADHIVEKGHQKIAVIGVDGILNNTRYRLEGIKAQLNKYPVQFEVEMLEQGAATYEGGEVAVQNLLARGVEFSAILAYNDAIAIGATSMLKAHGLSVPKDVSVVGFNDLILAQCIKPKLTTIHNPIEEMAMKATKLALSLSKNSDLREIESVADKHKYVPVLVQRHSVQEIS